ncbi:DUF4870 domain-containing protein [Agreia sp. VKM Ac-1783]|uniref:DUF4870 domain-containing protein n=1 Tax=Agreia sp. VKM Ac-1783 TaxID=1938889 RepID=UPI002015F281|nr:DUF4870 domain-containing protein [Agreia sp. VKM Ac-1783]
MTSAPPPSNASYQAQPPMAPQDQRLWATLIHLGGILFGFVPALVGYLVLKDRGEFIRQHTLEELNFQISLAIYLTATVLLGFVTFFIGTVLAFPIAIAAIIFMIIAAVKANAGDFYRYPLTIRLVK